MTHNIRIASPAKAEIAASRGYTNAEHGARVADDYVPDLDTAMLRLLDHPLLGEDCSHIRDGYRRIRARDHVIHYVPHDGGIEVMQVLHPRRDMAQRLRF